MTTLFRRAIGLMLALSLSILTVFEGGDCCRPAVSSGEALVRMERPDVGNLNAPGPVDTCPFPCAPAGCRAISGCAPAALTETRHHALVTPIASQARQQRADSPSHSRVSAPEPPPPRA